jgi:uncharacterized membrane protein required for colicin V production
VNTFKFILICFVIGIIKGLVEEHVYGWTVALSLIILILCFDDIASRIIKAIERR